ncbi:hypothetical protein TNCV_153461 [Trichonephila clavipes]|nr:hypothetical protein TNCV_153461 [Trichonephila clavipes]
MMVQRSRQIHMSEQRSRQTHMTQQTKPTDPNDSIATTPTLAITTISFIRLSTDSRLGECVAVVSIKTSKSLQTEEIILVQWKVTCLRIGRYRIVSLSGS